MAAAGRGGRFDPANRRVGVGIMRRFRRLFHKVQSESELDRELRSHFGPQSPATERLARAIRTDPAPSSGLRSKKSSSPQNLPGVGRYNPRKRESPTHHTTQRILYRGVPMIASWLETVAFRRSLQSTFQSRFDVRRNSHENTVPRSVARPSMRSPFSETMKVISSGGPCRLSILWS